MLVTLSGITTLVDLLQPEKAESPMLVTLSGIVMLVRLEQFRKAQLTMLDTLSGIDKLVNSVPPIYKWQFEQKALGRLL